MKIILAAPRGFCAGVNMAIECLDLSIKTLGPPVYVYHEIVHNKYVVETFQGKGAVFVDRLEDVPFGSNLLFPLTEYPRSFVSRRVSENSMRSMQLAH